MSKKYLFILCPPFQGSTLIYRLMDTSPSVSTFLGKAPHMGEGQCFIANTDKLYSENRWNKDYEINFQLTEKHFNRNWDMSKPVLCDKSPPNIIRADKIYDYFSKRGEVYFIIQIRDPYTTNYGSGHFGGKNTLNVTPKEISYKLWDRFAQMQKDTYEKYKDNSILITYEELCDDIHVVSNKILNKMPFIGSLGPEIIINSPGNGRLGKLKKVTSIKDGESKTEYFNDNNELLNYFNYKII